jgi:hypothetical protein
MVKMIHRQINVRHSRAAQLAKKQFDYRHVAEGH